MVWNKNKIIILDKELSASHYTWKDNNIIMATMYDSKRNCRYFFYNTETLEKNIVMEDLLVKDGHPTFVSENLFVTDTYPDKAGFQKILLVDTQKKEVKTVLSIYSSSKHMGVERCDLHPRYDFENNSVYFDADIDGRRRIYGFNLGDVK